MSLYGHELKTPDATFIFTEDNYMEPLDIEFTNEQLQEFYDELDITNEKVDMDEGYGAKLRPVFVTLIYSGTVFTKISGAVVKGQQYWHAAMGFGPSLSRLYSYGHDPKNNHSNRFKGGFCFESIDAYKERFPNGELEVSCIFLNDAKYKALKNTLNWYIENKEKTSYSVSNLFAQLFGKKQKDGVKPNLVCSTFVDTVLQSIDINVANKSSSLIKPDDLRSDGHEKQFKIYEGKIKDFSGGNAAMKVNKLANNLKNDYFYKDTEKKNQTKVAESVLSMVDEAAMAINEANEIINEEFTPEAIDKMSGDELKNKVNGIKDPKSKFFTALKILNKGI